MKFQFSACHMEENSPEAAKKFEPTLLPEPDNAAQLSQFFESKTFKDRQHEHTEENSLDVAENPEPGLWPASDDVDLYTQPLQSNPLAIMEEITAKDYEPATAFSPAPDDVDLFPQPSELNTNTFKSFHLTHTEKKEFCMAEEKKRCFPYHDNAEVLDIKEGDVLSFSRGSSVDSVWNDQLSDSPLDDDAITVKLDNNDGQITRLLTETGDVSHNPCQETMRLHLVKTEVSRSDNGVYWKEEKDEDKIVVLNWNEHEKSFIYQENSGESNQSESNQSASLIWDSISDHPKADLLCKRDSLDANDSLEETNKGEILEETDSGYQIANESKMLEITFDPSSLVIACQPREKRK